MKKTTIRQIAVWCRTQLLEQIARRGERTGLKDLMEAGAYAALLEEAAYTWYNRIMALRYMEVNGYLPDHIQLERRGRVNPRFTGEALLDLCGMLSTGLPEIFPVIGGAVEKLMPEELLWEDGVLDRLIREIPRELWLGSAELVGWLHQYYHTEDKKEAFGLLRQNIKITKERIPAATQLFTPDWIVSYMVENSLGRLWLDGHRDSPLRKKWKYFGDCAGEVRQDVPIKPEDIRFMDPCMGSGHILCRAFDLLMDMYREAGWSDRDAVDSILSRNLYGLDIDRRAWQLCCFTLIMKACSYDPSVLERTVRPRVYHVKDSRFLTDGLISFLAGDSLQRLCDLQTLREDFREAGEYGSILKVRPVDLEGLMERARTIAERYDANVMDALYAQQVREQCIPFFEMVQAMTTPCHGVVTNPPYMGKSAMDSRLRDYVARAYPDSKHDLYAVFIQVCSRMLADNGYQAMITQHTWMFLRSYERLRRQILRENTVIHMLHLGTGAFEEISGEVVQTAAWIMRPRQAGEKETAGTYVRLVESGSQKEQAYLHGAPVYEVKPSLFASVPGGPMVYWLPPKLQGVFARATAADTATVTNGLFTCDNKRFLRYWYEVPREWIALDCTDRFHCVKSKKRWFPYNKGGNYRRWYGNQEYIVDFENFGEDIRQYRTASGQSASMPGQDHYFRESLSWSLVSPVKFGIRYYPPGFVFDIAGSSIFPVDPDQIYSMLAVLASEPLFYLLKMINPTVNYQAGDIRKLPVDRALLADRQLGQWAKENVALAKEDWDSFEESWHYTGDPLAKIAREGHIKSIEACYSVWERQCESRVERVRHNETRINERVAKAMDMWSVTTCQVSREQTTLRLADRRRDAGNLISCVIGYMLGRYPQPDKERMTGSLSPAEPADSGAERPGEKSGAGFLPLRGGAGGPGMERFCEVLARLFGAECLEDNLLWLADSLQPDGKKTEGRGGEDARQTVWQYISRGFYREHVKRYNKRPVYWVTGTGPAGYRAMFYCHRLDEAMARALGEDARGGGAAELGDRWERIPLDKVDWNRGIPANRDLLADVLL